MPKKSTKLNKEEIEKLSYGIDETKTFFFTFRSFIMKFSQRRRLRSNDGSVGEDKTFPFFIWLLRDVTQSIPTDCRNIKEYFLTRVRQLILKRWTEMTKELIKRFPEILSASN